MTDLALPNDAGFAAGLRSAARPLLQGENLRQRQPGQSEAADAQHVAARHAAAKLASRAEDAEHEAQSSCGSKRRNNDPYPAQPTAANISNLVDVCDYRVSRRQFPVETGQFFAVAALFASCRGQP